MKRDAVAKLVSLREIVRDDLVSLLPDTAHLAEDVRRTAEGARVVVTEGPDKDRIAVD